jgi:microcystin degradation protein MlrC
MRIGVAGLWHETNTFAVETNDTLDSATVTRGADVLAAAHPKSFIGGFIDGVDGSGATLVPVAVIRFENGGLVRREAFEGACKVIVGGLRDAAPLDAIYIDLHGAMIAEDPYNDAEGELVRAIREVYPDTPMVGTYDFHAIMSDYETRQIVPFPNNTNPHIDGYERGIEAAGCLRAWLAGEIDPVTERVFVPILGPNIGQSTWAHSPDEEERLPLYQLNLRRAEMEETPGVVNITILGGYGYGDSPDAGMCILATTDGDRALARRMASELASELWTRRDEIRTVRQIYAIDTGVRMALERDDQPILLVDLGDDPGSATPADGPDILHSLIRLDAYDCALTIRDANAVRAGMEAGVGATVSLPIGASIDQRFYRPVHITATVKAIDDGAYTICGPSHGGWGREVTREAWQRVNVGARVVMRMGDNIDVIFSQYSTGKDRDFFRSAGVQLEDKKIIVVKSNQAHRASFDPIVAATIELDTPGVSTVNYSRLPYRHLRTPIWPIDPDMEWSPPE